MPLTKIGAAITLAVASSLVLAGCGTTTSDSADAADGAVERGPVDKILFDYPFTALPVYGAIVPVIEARAAEMGVTVEFTNDDMDLGKQVTNLNTFLSSDVDAVVAFPADPASLESIARSYMDAGKYWVTYGGDLENQDATLQFSFEESGRQLGEYAGQWAMENLGGTGKVLIIEDKSIQIGQERTKGIVEALAETAPELEVVSQQQAVTPDQGLTVTSAVLAQHPDVNIVLAAVGDAAQGAYQALVASGRAEDDPTTFVGGLDPNVFELQQMKAGNFFRASTYFSIVELVQHVIDIPIALGEGKQDASVDLPVSLVTAEDRNLDAYIAELGG
ncbi:sugar ABC transporter substrate-binding protein [Agromyces bauzanensis]